MNGVKMKCRRAAAQGIENYLLGSKVRRPPDPRIGWADLLQRDLR